MEQQKVFDEICGVAFINVFSLTKDKPRIVLSPFDTKNKEHLFLLNVAKSVGGVYAKPVAVDISRLKLFMMNCGFSKECKFQKATKIDKQNAINPNELLNFMRAWAEEVYGTKEFNFGIIYDTFYNRKGN